MCDFAIPSPLFLLLLSVCGVLVSFFVSFIVYVLNEMNEWNETNENENDVLTLPADGGPVMEGTRYCVCSVATPSGLRSRSEHGM